MIFWRSVFSLTFCLRRRKIHFWQFCRENATSPKLFCSLSENHHKRNFSKKLPPFYMYTLRSSPSCKKKSHSNPKAEMQPTVIQLSKQMNVNIETSQTNMQFLSFESNLVLLRGVKLKSRSWNDLLIELIISTGCDVMPKMISNTKKKKQTLDLIKK